MHIHILGICGTFMGGLAVLAKQAGHKVTGCDANVYPPMSTQLEEQGIELVQGFGAEQLALYQPDLFIIGNVVARGNPLMEAILNRNLPYRSGPQWMGEHILQDKWVLAVAGTHGKTTTSSMLAWILEDAGYAPGFLIGGVPMNFGISARLSPASPFFVIEADEYDTAFFDKRSKFVHYRAKTAILNNLEYDHADIFPDLAAIETQFHHLVRTVPGIGRLIVNASEPALQRVIARGCWSEQEGFGEESTNWTLNEHEYEYESDSFDVLFNHQSQGTVRWELTGHHNRLNALAAIAAARHVGVPAAQAISALARFENVKRRMEVRGEVGGVVVYDDFAHHPTAIATTLAGLRKKVGKARIVALLEPRSNTMKLGVMKQALPGSLSDADVIFAYQAASTVTTKDGLSWDVKAVLAPLGSKAHVFDELSILVERIVEITQPGDHILVMSNGGFGNVHQKILDALKLKELAS